MKPVYYLIHDNSVQWFTYIVEIDGNEIREMVKLPHDVSGEFLTNIVSRELHFTNKEFRGDTFCGWSISKHEFDKLSNIIQLYPHYKKYLKICHEN
jgi:hypothetical protein